MVVRPPESFFYVECRATSRDHRKDDLVLTSRSLPFYTPADRTVSIFLLSCFSRTEHGHIADLVSVCPFALDPAHPLERFLVLHYVRAITRNHLPSPHFLFTGSTGENACTLRLKSIVIPLFFSPQNGAFGPLVFAATARPGLLRGGTRSRLAWSVKVVLFSHSLSSTPYRRCLAPAISASLPRVGNQNPLCSRFFFHPLSIQIRLITI